MFPSHTELLSTTKLSFLLVVFLGSRSVFLLLLPGVVMISILTRMTFATIFMLFLSLAEQVQAQSQNDPCNCVNPQFMFNLDICIDNTQYTVATYGCKTVPPIGQLLAQICLGSDQQNQYTTITKLCFVGNKPATINAKSVFDALLCRMDPCKFPGNFGAQVGPNPGDIYCWTVVTPNCVRVVNSTGCIERCGDGCCVLASRWKRQADGSCTLDVKSAIQGGGPANWYCGKPSTNCEQIQSCQPIDCSSRETCCEVQP